MQEHVLPITILQGVKLKATISVDKHSNDILNVQGTIGLSCFMRSYANQNLY